MSNHPYKLQAWGPAGDYLSQAGNLVNCLNLAFQCSTRLDMEVILTRRWSGQPAGSKARPLPLPGKVGR